MAQLEQSQTENSSVYNIQAGRRSTRTRSICGRGRSYLQKKEPVFVVIRGGEDVTPKSLNPYGGVDERDKHVTVFDSSGVQKNTSKNDAFVTVQMSSFQNMSTKLHLKCGTEKDSESLQKSHITAYYVDDIEIEPEMKSSLSSMDDSMVASADRSIITEQPMPEKLTITLTETDTFFILDIPSSTVSADSDEAYMVKKDNYLYEFLTVGKGRNRKVVNAEVQTVSLLLKSRETTFERNRCKSTGSFASEWDLQDTYKEMVGKEIGKQDEDYEEVASDMNLKTATLLGDLKGTYQEIELKKLMKNSRFHDAICVMERLLANNNYSEQQKRFRGLYDPDPCREDLQYDYSLNLLWTFANEQTQGRCVTALCNNFKNEDIWAVGYGKFFFAEKTNGMVMIWNVKNPVQPERSYKFEDPVTAVHFSQENFNLLAVGFYTGKVVILDISNRELKVIATTTHSLKTFEPFWKVVFCKDNEYNTRNEYTIAINQDGRILKLWSTDNEYLNSYHYMRVAKGEGLLKGLQRMRKCPHPGLPVSRYSAALVRREHPTDKQFYFICTDEGVIHKCSVNFHYQHFDEFLAHDGPIYQMSFSPFCNKIFLTCGDDWFLRIWAEGVDEPLIELTQSMQSVQDAEWSPIHSTIIASICGTQIYLWDLQRKIYEPQSITESPNLCRNTLIKFTKDGRCLLVGDIDGHVHIYFLDNMPIPAFFKEVILRQSLVKALITRPDLVKRVKKILNA